MCSLTTSTQVGKCLSKCSRDPFKSSEQLEVKLESVGVSTAWNCSPATTELGGMEKVKGS